MVISGLAVIAVRQLMIVLAAGAVAAFLLIRAGRDDLPDTRTAS